MRVLKKIILCFALLCAWPAMADDKIAPITVKTLTEQEAREKVIQIMSGEEFGGYETKYRWKKKQTDSDALEYEEGANESFYERIFDWIKSIIDNLSFAIKLVLISILLIGIGYIAAHSKGLLNGVSSLFNRKSDVDVPTHLFGLDMKKDSLPKSVGDKAEQLIREKKYREALALLLRASFISVLYKHHVPVPASATEQECLRLFAQQVPRHQYQFLSALVRQWVLVAYAHEPPKTETLLSLCKDWRDAFELPTQPASNNDDLERV